MPLIHLLATLAACVLVAESTPFCTEPMTAPPAAASQSTSPPAPTKNDEVLDVVISAEAALVWDVASGSILYEKNAATRRPVASLSKLLSVLVIRDALTPETVVEIPPVVRRAQQLGAHIRLPSGEHATADELLEAGLVASANDALVTLAVAVSGSEAAFVEQANAYALSHQLPDTRLANATGLSLPGQHSTAHDIRRLLTAVAADPRLGGYLSNEAGTLTTTEGTARTYTSTNKLLGTYLPIVAGKTGYTTEAGQNLAIITRSKQGQQLGAVVLGSDERFQDTKVLVEWVERNFTWPGEVAAAASGE